MARDDAIDRAQRFDDRWQLAALEAPALSLAKTPHGVQPGA